MIRSLKTFPKVREFLATNNATSTKIMRLDKLLLIDRSDLGVRCFFFFVFLYIDIFKIKNDDERLLKFVEKTVKDLLRSDDKGKSQCHKNLIYFPNNKSILFNKG